MMALSELDLTYDRLICYYLGFFDSLPWILKKLTNYNEKGGVNTPPFTKYTQHSVWGEQCVGGCI